MPHAKSFDLLGSTYVWEHLNQDDWSVNGQHGHVRDSTLWDLKTCLRHDGAVLDTVGLCREETLHRESDRDIQGKLIQLLKITWLVFDYHPQTIDQGIAWLGVETMTQLLAVAQAFALLEKEQNEFLDGELLWRHSVRTGCLAGTLAKEECGALDTIMQSCVAGFSHDIGLVVLAVSLGSTRYLDVLSRARRESLSLATAELFELGLSHEIVGAEYLQRHRFPRAIVDAVAYHDNPLGLGRSEFTPTVAVYAANTLDGGGWPQDSDGVPSDRAMEYLSGHGYRDPWPKWQRSAAKIQGQELGYA
ncbi:MAG: hypothetical protein NPIRA05_11780 [Nitrospirales bacterium]|nr:MAG: hypothetical protein NPIRA05_11780 [Nitrospirales bacterium]